MPSADPSRQTKKETLQKNLWTMICAYSPPPHKKRHINPTTGSLSTNLAVCDPAICPDFTWSVYGDTCSSDHFSILRNSEVINEHPHRWGLSKADLEKREKLSKEKLKII